MCGHVEYVLALVSTGWMDGWMVTRVGGHGCVHIKRVVWGLGRGRRGKQWSTSRC